MGKYVDLHLFMHLSFFLFFHLYIYIYNMDFIDCIDFVYLW